MALFGRPSAEDEQRAAAWGEWVRARNPLAIGSFVLGVFSLVDLGVLLVPEIAGVVLGIVALRQIGSSPSGARGKALAWGGIALSVLSLAIALGLYLHRPHRS